MGSKYLTELQQHFSTERPSIISKTESHYESLRIVDFIIEHSSFIKSECQKGRDLLNFTNNKQLSNKNAETTSSYEIKFPFHSFLNNQDNWMVQGTTDGLLDDGRRSSTDNVEKACLRVIIENLILN